MDIKKTLEAIIAQAMQGVQIDVEISNLSSAILLINYVGGLESTLQEIAGGVFCD